jgi:hypothetical protein
MVGGDVHTDKAHVPFMRLHRVEQVDTNSCHHRLANSDYRELQAVQTSRLTQHDLQLSHQACGAANGERLMLFNHRGCFLHLKDSPACDEGNGKLSMPGVTRQHTLLKGFAAFTILRIQST